jgi:hypothetical protein
MFIDAVAVDLELLRAERNAGITLRSDGIKCVRRRL